MSWSVNASGKVEDVVEDLAKQFSMPLAEPPAGLADEGERETVKLVSDVVEQCLGTFAADRLVKVSANGHTIDCTPADWGPHVSTRRLADLSPGAARALGVKTDETVTIDILV